MGEKSPDTAVLRLDDNQVITQYCAPGKTDRHGTREVR